jgi:hypothetical protein
MEGDWGGPAGGAKSGWFFRRRHDVLEGDWCLVGWCFGFESFDGFVLKCCFKTGGRPGFLEYWHPARELDSTFHNSRLLSPIVSRMAWKNRPNRVGHVTMKREFTTWLAVPKSSKKRARPGLVAFDSRWRPSRYSVEDLAKVTKVTPSQGKFPSPHKAGCLGSRRMRFGGVTFPAANSFRLVAESLSICTFVLSQAGRGFKNYFWPALN